MEPFSNSINAVVNNIIPSKWTTFKITASIMGENAICGLPGIIKDSILPGSILPGTLKIVDPERHC